MRHYFKLSVILFLAFHFSMCKAQKYCDCCGEYIYKKKSDGENIIWTIRLSADSSYSFLCNRPVLLLSEERILCKTSCGKWCRRNDTLLFEQYSPIYIKKEDTCKITNDSIHIKIIRKSNGLPHKNYELSCWYTEGKIDYNLNWEYLSKLGKSNGFEWGGDWKFKDMPHFENMQGNSLEELRALPKDNNGLPILKP